MDAQRQALQEFCNRWCKREHVKSNALNSWKLNIFEIIDGRNNCNNLDLLPPKIVSEYDQEIPQSQTADNPVAP